MKLSTSELPVVNPPSDGLISGLAGGVDPVVQRGETADVFGEVSAAVQHDAAVDG